MTENMEANWHDSRQSEENLEEYLHAQILLADYTELERVIMEYLICSLDSRGYFFRGTCAGCRSF